MDRRFTELFESEICPILDSFKDDKREVYMKGFQSVEDGYLPAWIAVNSTCYAYTLHLKEKLEELFPEYKLRVANSIPADLTDWEEY